MKKSVLQNPGLFRQPKKTDQSLLKDRFKMQLRQIAKVDGSKDFIAVTGYN